MTTFKSLLKTTLTPVAICLTLAIAAPAIAKKGHHHNTDGMREILSELSLTDTQKQDIKQILKQTRADRELFKSDANSLKTELRNLIHATQWDQSAVENAIGQRQALTQEKALQRANNKNQVWNLLTESQQAQFVAQMETQKADRNKMGKADKIKDKRKGKRQGKMFKRLDLSEQQVAAIATIKDNAKAAKEASKAKLKTFKQAERTIIQSSEFSAQAWQELSAQHQADFLEVAVLKAKTQHDIWNVFTADQQAKLEKMNKRKGHKKGHSKDHKKGHKKDQSTTD